MRLGLIGAQDRSSLSGVYSASDNVQFKTSVCEIDTYVYINNNFNHGSISGLSVYDLDISRDGSNLYLTDVATGSQSIDHFTLSTPYDITTASFVSRITNLTTSITGPGEGSATGIVINDDGTIISICGAGGDKVYNYYLPTPYSLTNALYGNIKTCQVIGSGSGQDTQAQAITFGDNGTKMYIVGYTNDRIYQWNLTTAWDISTASYSNKSLSVTTQEGEPRGLFIGDNGTKVYIVGPVNDQVRQYNLSTPWDISTGSYVAGTSVLLQDSIQQGIYFKPDGTKMFMVGTTNDRVYEYSLSSAWDISTLSFTTSNALLASYDILYSDIIFSSDGTKMYLVGDNNNTVDMFTLSTAWDISNISYSTEISLGGAPLSLGAPYGLDISSDGSKLYVLDGTYGVKQFDMLVFYQLASTNIGYYSIAGQSGASQAIAFGDDGTKMYITDDTNDRVYQYNLTIPWIPTSYTTTFYNSISISQEATPQGIVFAKNGQRLFLTGPTSDNVYQYNLSTPWDISTASYSNKKLLMQQIDQGPRGITCSPSGHRIYVLGEGNDFIYQFEYLF